MIPSPRKIESCSQAELNIKRNFHRFFLESSPPCLEFLNDHCTSEPVKTEENPETKLHHHLIILAVRQTLIHLVIIIDPSAHHSAKSYALHSRLLMNF